MTREELNALRDECYKIACDHGFHDVGLSEQHYLCLVISELMEAVEADRKNRYADLDKFKQANEVFTFSGAFEHCIKDTLEDELADAAIRILDLAGYQRFDIGSMVEVDLCRGDNATRDHTLLKDYFENHSFTESIYEIVEQICYHGYDLAMTALFELADALDIDLMQHIRLKMDYNRTRERLHGKKY